MLDKAIVTYVDVNNCTVDLTSESNNRRYEEIQFAGLYTHNDHRGGVFVVPELGSYAFVHTDVNGESHVFGFVNSNNSDATNEKGSERVPDSDDRGFHYRRNRSKYEPGDIFLGTADGNQVLVRRGGLVQIEASPLAQTLYIPVGNIIRHYFQQYQAYSPLGEIEWSHPTLVDGETVGSNTTETPVVVKYSVKRLAQEDVTGGRFSVELRAGMLNKKTLDTETDNEHLFANADASKEAGNWSGKSAAEGAISLVVYSHDSEKTVFTFQVSSEGDLFMRVVGNVHAEIDGKTFIRAKDDVEVSFGANAQSVLLTQAGALEAYIQRAVLDAVQKVLIKAPLVEVDAKGGLFTVKNCSVASVNAASVELGSVGALLPILRDNGILAALGNHVHTVSVPVAGTGAAAVAAGFTGTAPGLAAAAIGSPSLGVKSK